MSSDGGKCALDVLEKMVQITMMRGAQTGGVVTFMEDGKSMKGCRSLVVNTKRGDLSQKIRKKLEKDMRGKHSQIQGFFGHTRFATSSVATIDGCHPHRWSPRHVYRAFYPFPVISIPENEHQENTDILSAETWCENTMTENNQSNGKSKNSSKNEHFKYTN